MNAAPPPALSPGDIRRVLTGLSLAMFLSALDQTIVVAAMPTIGLALNDFQHVPWIVTAYLVASTAVTPLAGRLSDSYGVRGPLLAGVAVFIAGSIACALAPSMIALAVARAVQGLGGGGLIALAQTSIGELVSPRERGRYQSYFATVFALSSFAGPALGGVFAQYLHWSLIFWINVPLGLAAFVLVRRRLIDAPRRRAAQRIDFFGAALLAPASGCFVVAMGEEGAAQGLNFADAAPTLAASAAFFALFAWRNATADEPFIPVSVLSNRIARRATIASAFGLGCFIGLSSVMPLYFENGLGLPASQSGLALIPMMIGTVAGATVAGRMMARIYHYKRPPLVALALATGACALLAWRLPQLSLVEIEVLLAVAAIGVGSMLPICTVSVQNAVPPKDLGAATATMQFFRQLAGALIAAVFGALAVNATAAGAPEQAFRFVLAAAAGCVFLCLLFLALMEERPLHEKRLG
jgi:EmrB/QacA subfamily drug resistance transporter